jgi:hypothetical protein
LEEDVEDEEEGHGGDASAQGDQEQQSAAESYGAGVAAQEALQSHNARIKAVVQGSDVVKKGLTAWAHAARKASLSELQALRLAACKAFGARGVYLGCRPGDKPTALGSHSSSSSSTSGAVPQTSRQARGYIYVFLGDVCSLAAQLGHQLKLLPHAIACCRQLCREAAERDAEDEGEVQGAAGGGPSLATLTGQLDVLLELEEQLPALLHLMDVR